MFFVILGRAVAPTPPLPPEVETPSVPATYQFAGRPVEAGRDAGSVSATIFSTGA